MLISSNRKKKIKSFNDGLLEFGVIEKKYNEAGDATTKEFVKKNELFFSFSSIREEDFSKYNEDHRLVLKVETYLTQTIAPTDVVKINDVYYDINHIDPASNQMSQFIYLDSHLEDLKYQLELLTYERISPIQNPIFNHLKTEWCDIIKETSFKNNQVNQTVDLTKKIIFAIPYHADLANNFKKLNNIRVKFNSNLYRVVEFVNVDSLNKIIELTCEAI